MSSGTLRVTWVRSAVGYRRSQRATLRGLGLRRLRQTIVVHDHPAIRGMLHRVRHLVRVEE